MNPSRILIMGVIFLVIAIPFAVISLNWLPLLIFPVGLLIVISLYWTVEVTKRSQQEERYIKKR